MAQIELHNVPGWSADHVAQLMKSWINSTEQVVAVSVTRGVIASLAQQMNVSREKAQRLVNLARAALSPEARAEMGQRFDSDQRGRGANASGKEDDDKQSGQK
jgi:DNA repair ATPase RecN